MTVLTFDPARALLRRLATADPDELPVLQREACALLRLVPPAPEPECDDLTDRERDVLETLGWRVAKSTIAVSMALTVDERWARRLLSRLADKGYAERIGAHKGGGWVRVAERAALPKAA